MNNLLLGWMGVHLVGCGQGILESELAKEESERIQPVTPQFTEILKAQEAQQTDPNQFRFPAASEITSQSNAEQISRGKELIEQTYLKLPENVGASMKCSNCHLNAGTVQKAMTFVGVDDRYPRYRARSGKEDTLADRINGCFERSMNGTALDVESDDMKAMIAYMEWISSEVEDGQKVVDHGLPKLTALTPDPSNGEILYTAKCASCHQMNGGGLKTPDGTLLYPSLWGDDSFNIGAGMARLNSAAAFIKWNMPLGQGGSLSDQEAYDIAAYFSSQPRPDLAKKDQDWLKGGKPDDARY